MASKLQVDVRTRAGEACEYCLMPQRFYRLRFPFDHIIARQHGGGTTPENLALACYHCNGHKGPNIAGIDPLTRELTRLFNPRIDTWSDHFAWVGPQVIGQTAIGRTTIMVLALNDPLLVAACLEAMVDDVFPPKH